MRIDAQSIHAHEQKAAAGTGLSVPSISTVPAPSPPKHSAALASVPVIPGPIAEVSPEEQLQLREKARDMFYHAYDSYMQNAYPEVSYRKIYPLPCCTI